MYDFTKVSVELGGSYFRLLIHQNPSFMNYTKNIDMRGIGNAKVSSRLKQLLVLLGAILIGMIISISVNAA